MAEFSKITGGLSKTVSCNNSRISGGSDFTDSEAAIMESMTHYAMSLARISATGSDEIDGSDTMDYYSIAESTADRSGLAIYMSSITDTVALAKADNENTVPAIGIIDNDANTTVRVRNLAGLVSLTLADSDSNIQAGDRIYLSNIEAGKVTDNVPTFGIIQPVGRSKSNAVGNTIQLIWDPKTAIYL